MQSNDIYTDSAQPYDPPYGAYGLDPWSGPVPGASPHDEISSAYCSAAYGVPNTPPTENATGYDMVLNMSGAISWTAGDDETRRSEIDGRVRVEYFDDNNQFKGDWKRPCSYFDVPGTATHPTWTDTVTAGTTTPHSFTNATVDLYDFIHYWNLYHWAEPPSGAT